MTEKLAKSKVKNYAFLCALGVPATAATRITGCSFTS